MTYNTVKLIFGYLPTVDRRSYAARFLPIAAKAGLPERVAIIFNTYRPDKGPDMYFDWELLIAILQEVLAVFRWDSLLIDLGDKQLTSLEDLKAYYQNWQGPDLHPDDPPQTIRVMQGNTSVCFIATEDYTGIGGPDPYHDSLTFSFYCKTQDLTAFRGRCRREIYMNTLFAITVANPALH